MCRTEKTKMFILKNGIPVKMGHVGKDTQQAVKHY
jgi:hypothetical protein